jgi:hypothetical protein
LKRRKDCFTGLPSSYIEVEDPKLELGTDEST